MQVKTTTYRIIALTMAFLIFFSSVGFSIDTHYCQGKLKSFSLFGKAKSCYQLADASSQKTCVEHVKKIKPKKNTTCSIEQKACCEHKEWQFQLEQDQQIPYVELAKKQSLQQFLVAYITVFHQHHYTRQDLSDEIQYKPPLIARDIPVLVESFLL